MTKFCGLLSILLRQTIQGSPSPILLRKTRKVYQVILISAETKGGGNRGLGLCYFDRQMLPRATGIPRPPAHQGGAEIWRRGGGSWYSCGPGGGVSWCSRGLGGGRRRIPLVLGGSYARGNTTTPARSFSRPPSSPLIFGGGERWGSG